MCALDAFYTCENRKVYRCCQQALLNLHHIDGGGTFCALFDAEFNFHTFGQAPKARGLYGRIMDKNIIPTRIASNKPIALLIAEPLDGPSFTRTHGQFLLVIQK